MEDYLNKGMTSKDTDNKNNNRLARNKERANKLDTNINQGGNDNIDISSGGVNYFNSSYKPKLGINDYLLI